MENKQIWRGWDVVEHIGSGAFSNVYKIKKDDDSGDFYSALKVISVPKDRDEYRVYRADGYDDESITQIFKSQVDDLVKEFKLMARFRGTTNVVSYEDHMIVPKEDGIGWNVLIRMELLAPLPEYYQKAPLDERTTVKLGVDICRALELCEKFNIVHRDIKPQNIFVNDFGDFKLGDFGVARAMEHTTHATKTGTYSYMAPEVYHGEKYNCSADMYSLGLVLYWLLNERRLPFVPLPPTVPTPSQNSEAQSRRFGGEALPPPLHGDEQLKSVVLRACAFNPADRYKTAEEMGSALNRLLLQMKAEGEQPQKSEGLEYAVPDTEEQTAMVSAEAKAEPTAENDENKTVLILKKREEAAPAEQPAAAEEVPQPAPAADDAEGVYSPAPKADAAVENSERPADYTAYDTDGKADADNELGNQPDIDNEPESLSEEYDKEKKKAARILYIILALALACFIIGMVVEAVSEWRESQSSVVYDPSDSDYADSSEDNWQFYTPTVALKNAKVGDCVFFGAYEQDNNTSNGKEEIEWLVLDVRDGKALLISKYALDYQRYNDEYTNVTWESCTLRKWLNDEFLYSAFSSSEIDRIPTVTVSADKNPEYDTSPGNATQDKVFLLSITEAVKYFPSYSERKCGPTDYTEAQGAYTSYGNCWWWLRSPGIDQGYAACVGLGGGVNELGYYVYYDSYAVRPALWIDLNS